MGWSELDLTGQNRN